MANTGCHARNADRRFGIASDVVEVGAHAENPPQMSFKELWHNGAKRLLLVLIVIAVMILLVVGGVAAGIFYLTIRIQKIDNKQGEIVNWVATNTSSITDLSNSVNEGWQTFQRSNPTQPVPQIADVTEQPAGKTEVVVKPPIAKPKPTSTPKIQTRTVIKYKKRPTPKPFKLFGK